MDVPEPAVELLKRHYQNAPWTLLHAWVSEDTVLAVVAVAGEGVFDEVADAFDVDGVRIEYLQLFDTVQEGWELSLDAGADLGDVFGELVRVYEGRDDEDADPDALQS